MTKQLPKCTAEVIFKQFKKQLFIQEFEQSKMIINQNNTGAIFHQLQFTLNNSCTNISIQQEIEDSKHPILDKTQIMTDWTMNELETLKSLYEEHGPSWTFLSSKFNNKSQTSIKNKIYNGLRRASRLLNQIEGKIYKNTKKTINTDMLLIIMDFVFKLSELISQQGLMMNYQNKFFIFRSELLDLCLRLKQEKKEKLVELVKLIKLLNSKIRSFGIFKTKNRRKWNLSKQGLQRICSCDDIVKQNRYDVERKGVILKNQKQPQVSPLLTYDEQLSFILVQYQKDYQRQNRMKPVIVEKDLQKQLFQMLYSFDQKDQFDDVQVL